MSDTPLSISPEPTLAPPAPKSKRVLLKWSLLATALFFAFLMWQCGSGLVKGGRASDIAVAEFHRDLDAGNFEQICSRADAGLQESDKKEGLIKFLSAIHRKLGNALAVTRGMININANTSGTFLTLNYTTHFEQGSAEETFVWRKSVAGDLKLIRYNIQSNALIVQ